LAFLFIGFLVYTFNSAKQDKKENVKIDKQINKDDMIEEIPNTKAFFLIIIGLIGLIYG
jgi:hypothetical protein